MAKKEDTLLEADRTKVPPPLPHKKIAGSQSQSMATAGVSGVSALRSGDPFGEAPEPRMPKSSLPEDKIDYFRTIVRQKSEALQRARDMYYELISEAEQWKNNCSLEKTRADLAQTKLLEVDEELQANLADRKDLAKALEQMETQVLNLTSQYNLEKKSSHSLTLQLTETNQELIQVKNQADNLLSQIDSLRAEREEINTSHLQQIQQLKEELAKDKQYIQDLETHFGEIQNNEHALHEEIDLLHTEIVQMELSLESSQEASQARIKELERLNSEQLAVVDSLRHQLAVANEKTTENKAQETQANTETLRAQLRETKQRTQLLADQLQTLQSEAEHYSAERRRYQEELAVFKKKLITAESAIEAAAMLKMKVVRLEAQLKNQSR
jgi:chromosome segregation ATPase